MSYDAATIEDARQMRLRAWVDRISGVLTANEHWSIIRRLRAEWGDALYQR